jgi:hypothetical protein
MYYRMTRLHWDENEFDALMTWARSIGDRVEGIDGLKFADLVRTGDGQGMVMAGYETEDHYRAASGTVASILEEMSDFLTDTPHGHEGASVLSFKQLS